MRRMFSEKQIQELIKATKKDISSLVNENQDEVFIGGEGTNQEVSGVEITYNKWSLSGTHLMFVVAGNIANATAITSGTTISKFEIPSWVFDKIVPIITKYIDRKSFQLFDGGLTTQSVTISLTKETATVDVSMSSITLTADRYFRYNFDLLIA